MYAALHDHLVVHARREQPANLRVFRSDGKFVAGCPDGPHCRSATNTDYIVDVPLEAPVSYHVILVMGTLDVPTSATMSAFLEAARLAGARVVTSERAVEVR